MVAKRWWTIYRARAWFRITSELSLPELNERIAAALSEMPWLSPEGEPNPLQPQDTPTPGPAFQNSPLEKNEREFELLLPAIRHQQFFPFDKYLLELLAKLKVAVSSKEIVYCYSFESCVLWHTAPEDLRSMWWW
jgi:hypothetical protein